MLIIWLRRDYEGFYLHLFRLSRPGAAVVREDVEFERDKRARHRKAGQRHQVPNDCPMASRKVFDVGEIHGAGPACGEGLTNATGR